MHMERLNNAEWADLDREDRPDEAWFAGPDAAEKGGAPSGMTPEEREERSRLGRYLRRAAFPATRPKLIAEARETAAPDDIAALLQRLPDDGQEFKTVAEVWAALEGLPKDQLESRF
jgi:hypothetical protein